LAANVRLITVRFNMRNFFTASALLLFTASCASSFHCREPFPVTVPIAFHWGCPTVQTPVLATPMNTSITNQANGNVSVLFDSNLDLQQQTTKLTATAAAFLDFPIRRYIPFDLRLEDHPEKPPSRRRRTYAEVN